MRGYVYVNVLNLKAPCFGESRLASRLHDGLASLAFNNTIFKLDLCESRSCSYIA